MVIAAVPMIALVTSQTEADLYFIPSHPQLPLSSHALFCDPEQVRFPIYSHSLKHEIVLALRPIISPCFDHLSSTAKRSFSEGEGNLTGI